MSTPRGLRGFVPQSAATRRNLVQLKRSLRLASAQVLERQVGRTLADNRQLNGARWTKPPAEIARATADALRAGRFRVVSAPMRGRQRVVVELSHSVATLSTRRPQATRLVHVTLKGLRIREVSPYGSHTASTIRSIAMEASLRPTHRRSEYVSPGGLKYGMDMRDGHRIVHVLRHHLSLAPPHTEHSDRAYFRGTQASVLRTLDSAYARIRQGHPDVHAERAGGRRTVYTVNMGRPIGFSAEGEPVTTFLRVVLKQGRQVITAFPITRGTFEAESTR